MISIIIPVLNEQAALEKLLPYLVSETREVNCEILVADGDSSDLSVQTALQWGCRVLFCPERGRAFQMNFAAEHAGGDVLYFLHADTRPPAGFVRKIDQALTEGHEAGCFRFKFDGGPLLLKLNSWCTRFKGIMFRGGDQSLFITRQLFYSLGAYNESFVIMEEYDLIRSIMKVREFYIIPADMLVSARKYEDNSYLKINIANYRAMRMFIKGAPPWQIAERYRASLKKLR